MVAGKIRNTDCQVIPVNIHSAIEASITWPAIHVAVTIPSDIDLLSLLLVRPTTARKTLNPVPETPNPISTSINL